MKCLRTCGRPLAYMSSDPTGADQALVWLLWRLGGTCTRRLMRSVHTPGRNLQELVAPEDLFFHQYFAERAKAAAVRRKAKKEGGDADEEDFDVTGDADKFDEEEFARYAIGT